LLRYSVALVKSPFLIRLAEKSLTLFKDIEKKGGFYKQIENEFIQDQIAIIRFNKIKLLTQRRQAMVGVNKYPNLMESISKEILAGIDLNHSQCYIELIF